MILALFAVWQLAACDDTDQPPADDGGTAVDGGRGGAPAPTGGAPRGGSNASDGSHAGSAGNLGGSDGQAGAAAGAGNERSAAGAGGVTGASGAAGEGGAAESSGTGAGAAASASGAAAEGGAAGASGAISGHELVYVSRILGGILACSLDGDGIPTLLPGGPIRPTGHATSLAVHPTQKFVYVADEDKHVYVFPIGADGSLPTEPSSSVATSSYPLSLAIEPRGRFAYVASDQGTAIDAFAIDSDTGALTAVGEPLLVGDGPDHSQPAFIATEPGGHFVYVSQRTQQGIRGYAIEPTSGALSEIEGSPFAASGLPPGDNLWGGAIVFKASGDFAFTSGGALNAFSLDPTSGKLTLVEGSPFTLDVQSDPNAPNLAIDPQGKYIYATRFLLNNHVSGFAIDPTNGKLDAVPARPSPLSRPIRWPSIPAAASSTSAKTCPRRRYTA